MAQAHIDLRIHSYHVRYDEAANAWSGQDAMTVKFLNTHCVPAEPSCTEALGLAESQYPDVTADTHDSSVALPFSTPAEPEGTVVIPPQQ